MGLAVIVVRAPSLTFAGSLLSLGDLPAHVPGCPLDSEASPNHAGTKTGQMGCRAINFPREVDLYHL